MNKISEFGKGVLYCDFDGKILFVKEGYWVGFVLNKFLWDKFVIYFCFIGYCNLIGVYKYCKG